MSIKTFITKGQSVGNKKTVLGGMSGGNPDPNKIYPKKSLSPGYPSPKPSTSKGIESQNVQNKSNYVAPTRRQIRQNARLTRQKIKAGVGQPKNLNALFTNAKKPKKLLSVMSN
jgi:hypothetical protein